MPWHQTFSDYCDLLITFLVSMHYVSSIVVANLLMKMASYLAPASLPDDDEQSDDYDSSRSIEVQEDSQPEED